MNTAKFLLSRLDDSKSKSYKKEDSSTKSGESRTLSWNVDKSKALFSDVEIIVVPEIDESTKRDKGKVSTKKQSYFAHVSVIACGERGSLLFFNAAQSSDFVTNNSSIHVEIPPRLVPHFSKLMDYLYDDTFVISSDNAIQLRMFSYILEIPQLEVTVNEYIAKDMNPRNVARYLMRIIEIHQGDINDDDQFKAAIKEVAKNFDVAMSRDITSLEPETLKQIVTEPTFKANSMNYSDALLNYMKMHGDVVKIGDKLFESLVCCKVMPELSIECAVFLLKELEFSDVENNEVCNFCRENSFSLKKRCMDSIACLIFSHSHKHCLLRELSSELLYDFQWNFFEKTLSSMKHLVPTKCVDISNVFLATSLPDAHLGLRFVESIKYGYSIESPRNLTFRLMGLENNFRMYRSECHGYELIYNERSKQWEMRNVCQPQVTICYTLDPGSPPVHVLQRRSWMPTTNNWRCTREKNAVNVEHIYFQRKVQMKRS